MAVDINMAAFYKPDDIEIKGHSLGYFSEKDIDITKLPAGAVTGCRNMDFFKGYDAIRQPYDLYLDLTSVLPAGYEILRFSEKQFTDDDGNNARVLIVAAKSTNDSTQPVKIFINSYYLPEKSYDNAWKNGTYTAGWQPAGTAQGWYELTQRHKHGDTGIQFFAYNPYIEYGGDKYQLKAAPTGIAKAIFERDRDYFKGWYVLQQAGAGSTVYNVVGIVTASISGYTGSTYDGTYFKILVEDGVVLDQAIKMGISRFPVNEFNNGNWEKIEDIRFETGFPNTVRMFCGYDSRPLILTFINKRQYFGGFTTTEPAYIPTSHSGWLTVYRIPGVTTSKTYRVKCIKWLPSPGFPLGHRIQFAWSDDDFATTNNLPEIFIPYGTYYFDRILEMTLGLSIRLRGNITDFQLGHQASFDVLKGDTNTWNGFWFGFDIPEVINKKWYKYKSGDVHWITAEDIGRELGLKYSIETDFVWRGENQQTEKIYSLACEIDGYQTLFIKHVFVPKHKDGTPVVNDDFLTVIAYFSPAFDRRLTAHLLYFAEDLDYDIPEGGSSDEYEVPETTRFNDVKRGYYQINKMGTEVNTSGSSKKVMIIDTADINLIDSATGEKLTADRLRNWYWKSIIQKAKYGIRVGDNIVAINLSNETANADKDNEQLSQGNGFERICVSQIQAGSNAAGVLTTERIRQITDGYELVGGAWAMESQFFIFTNYEAYWYDIVDEADLKLRDPARFPGEGLVNPDAIAVAREVLASQAGPLTAPLSSLFEGIYYATPNTINGIKQNKPVDLLTIVDENGNEIASRWGKEYKELQNKEGIRAGYRGSTSDVYFWIPELNRIMVWNIPGQHWKIYNFPDQGNIKYFVQEQDGELYFHTDKKIYKTEELGTTKTDDNESADPVEIDIYLKGTINHGNSQVMKVLDGFEITYDIIQPAGAELNIKVGRKNASGDVYNKDIDLDRNDMYWKQQYSMRTRGQYYNYEIQSVPGKANKLYGFRLLMMKLRGLLTVGDLTHE
jgi:hypothetical protein